MFTDIFHESASVGHDPDQALVVHLNITNWSITSTSTFAPTRSRGSWCPSAFSYPMNSVRDAAPRTADEATPATPAPKVTASPIWMVNEPDVFE